MAEWMKTLLQGLVAVTPWATALTLALLLARRLAKGRVPARAWRAVWLVLALRLALPVDVSLQMCIRDRIFLLDMGGNGGFVVWQGDFYHEKHLLSR